jgi:predicted enzyme related to lactoylglutathione lyase
MAPYTQTRAFAFDLRLRPSPLAQIFESEHPQFAYSSFMDPIIKGAIPVLPAADPTESLKWWTEICGFQETFRDASPPNYAGIKRGEAYLHISGMTDKELARKVGDQTMVRIAVQGIETLYAEYQKNGGRVHPNGSLQTKPWGTREFGAIDPNGVCVTFQE